MKVVVAVGKAGDPSDSPDTRSRGDVKEMKTMIHRRHSRVRGLKGRASVLLYSVFLLSVAGVAVISLTTLVNHNFWEVRRTEERLVAFYIAEAGVQRVVDWFNRGHNAWLEPRLPENNDTDPKNNISLYTWSDGQYSNTAFQNFFAPDPATGKFVAGTSSVFAQRLAAAGKTELEIKMDYPVYLPVIRDPSTSANKGTVFSLLLQPPITSGPDADPIGTVARVICVGETNVTKVQSTVWVRMYDNPVPELVMPAPIISKGGAASNGQFNVNWGEIWTKDDMILPRNLDNKFTFPTPKQDPWFYARSEKALRGGNSNLQYADGTQDSGYNDNPIAPGSPNYFIPYLSSIVVSKDKDFKDRENLLQYQTLKWPTYDYNTMKTLVLRQGYDYYRTTSSGDLIVGEDSSGNPIIKSFYEVFNRNGGDNPLNPNDIDRKEFPPIVFIDTIDGKPPRADGSNMATIRNTGSGPFYHGLFFIAANIYMGGAGNSPMLQKPERPDGTSGSPITNCRVHGLLYSYGMGEFQGGGDVYGALFAERGFAGGGSWSIYYDISLSDPLRNRVGSSIRVRLWNTY